MAAVFLAVICLCIYGCVSDQEEKTITAEPGRDVSLPCRAGHDGDIDAVELSRPDLDPKDVLLYRDGRIETENQHPSYQNRVDLQDRQMKDGDVSLILKKVTTDDTGTYECSVHQRGRNRRKRDIESKSIIHLEVSPPGRGHLGLTVGLSAVGIIVMVVVGVWIYKRRTRLLLPVTQSDLNQ
ncbi:butyrophilin-like protein 8 [Melanotaenia boesemani]|uniref:butyrophilin-like protein 8 n=1 Tax=Melanotaenia boesemani TaxID=1250792 RepID=UPI001C03EE61|nr:butyrophilin-like protein 8 [Melanotaenia boesemani]